MKASQCFFPTRTHIKFKQAHQQHTYQVVKLNQHAINETINEAEPLNIFRDRTNPIRKQEVKKDYFRPVGGKQLFKKIEQQRGIDRKLTKRKTMRDFSQNNIVSNTRFKRDPQEATQKNLPTQTYLSKKELQKPFQPHPEEILKSHVTYDPYMSASKLRKTCLTPKLSNKSQNAYRPATSNIEKHQQWAAKQRSQYQDKSAFLNEINFNKPLVEVYGDRYFEFMLRNRFQDDLKPHPYVYLISNKKQSESRAITKLKHYRPDIKQKQMLAVQGRKLKTDSELL